MEAPSPPRVDAPPASFLARNEFLIRRLHSLSGLVPVGAYMVVHLLTNATVNESAAAFQGNVYKIHSLGKALPLIEWAFIFLPLLFHAIIGVVIIQGGLPNTSSYALPKNIRYTLQRATGMIAFAFIMWHVFHMHGWIHADWWINRVARPLGGAQFRPYNAASTAGVALQSIVVSVLYAIGVLSCVYHLANGIWTMGITWGVWTSPAAQRRADRVCMVFGLGLALVGLSALYGMWKTGRGDNLKQAIRSENQMYNFKTLSGEVAPSPEKRSERPPVKNSQDAQESDEAKVGE